MQPTPYLFFNGNCRDAIEAYVDILGAEIVSSMPASEMPPDFPVPRIFITTWAYPRRAKNSLSPASM